MFRRCMIVCWVLFSLGAGTGLVGWAGNEYYARQAAAIVTQAQEEFDSEQSADSPNEFYFGPIASTVESREIEKQAEPFVMIGILGGIIAGVFLLWNIICHTGHWIWMGRKEQ